MSNWFNIENDGITVNIIREEKLSYVKYPPHSKFLLVRNLIYVAILTILVISTTLVMFLFDDIEWTHYALTAIIWFAPVMVLRTTIKEWKKGRYYE